MTSLYGKNLLCTQDLSYEELVSILNVAKKMKNGELSQHEKQLFQNKTFLMFFHNPSVRTHISFVAAATALGGHAEFFTPNMTRLNQLKKVEKRSKMQQK